jgi:hypothetical protein
MKLFPKASERRAEDSVGRFAQGSGKGSCHLLLWLPTAIASGFPVIVYTHGPCTY